MARRFKLLEQALVIEEQLRRAAYLNLTQEQNNPLMALNSRINDLELFAEANKDVLMQYAATKDPASVKPMNIVLQKVMTQLDEICADIKTEGTRVPNALARVPSVSNRLQLSERSMFVCLIVCLFVLLIVLFLSTGILSRLAMQPQQQALFNSAEMANQSAFQR